MKLDIGPFTLVSDIEHAEIGLLDEWEVIEDSCQSALIEFHDGSQNVREKFESSDNFIERGRVGDVRYYRRI